MSARHRGSSLAGTFLLLLLCGIPVASVANLAFECDPPICEVVFGDSLDVYVTVDGTVTDLRGFSVVIGFDPSVVTPLSINPGALIDGSCAWYMPLAVVEGDSIRVDAAGLGCSVNGPGRILRIRFRGDVLGFSPLTWRLSILRNALNEDIPHTCVPGGVTVISPPTAVEPTTWGAVKARRAP